jgi:hypothetical protein
MIFFMDLEPPKKMSRDFNHFGVVATIFCIYKGNSHKYKGKYASEPLWHQMWAIQQSKCGYLVKESSRFDHPASNESKSGLVATAQK